MATYLLTWNPNNWLWDDFEQRVESVNAGYEVTMEWSTGGTKRIVEDDRFFMMRLGCAPKGIIGSGLFLGGVSLGEHYNDEGRTANYAPIQFDALVAPKPEQENYLSLSELNAQFPLMKWTPQASGISIRELYLIDLEKLWEKRLAGQKVERQPLLEGVIRRVMSDQRERNPEARLRCIEHYGLTCVICQFNFEETYGESGKGFIHVHHLKPLSRAKGERAVNPVRDMRPVCANCHSVIHRQQTPRTIEEMRLLIQK